MKLTKEHKEGAELFYSEFQKSLSGLETKDECIADIIIAVRKYARDQFIHFMERGGK